MGISMSDMVPEIPSLADMLGLPASMMQDMIKQAQTGMMILIGVIILSKLYPIVFPRPDPMEKMMEMQMQQMQMENIMRRKQYGQYG